LARASCTRKHRREGEEETCLDKCFTVVKYFASLDADSKTRLADCLGSNLSALVRKSALQVRVVSGQEILDITADAACIGHRLIPYFLSREEEADVTERRILET